ncbi:MAG: hypothetical protein CALGDGBN_02803 [Pseudomonadales bacterium]|nr:hypothetical protein [Pseudomonadales bacterium]
MHLRQRRVPRPHPAAVREPAPRVVLPARVARLVRRLVDPRRHAGARPVAEIVVLVARDPVTTLRHVPHHPLRRQQLVRVVRELRGAHDVRRIRRIRHPGSFRNCFTRVRHHRLRQPPHASLRLRGAVGALRARGRQRDRARIRCLRITAHRLHIGHVPPRIDAGHVVGDRDVGVGVAQQIARVRIARIDIRIVAHFEREQLVQRVWRAGVRAPVLEGPDVHRRADRPQQVQAVLPEHLRGVRPPDERIVLPVRRGRPQPRLPVDAGDLVEAQEAAPRPLDLGARVEIIHRARRTGIDLREPRCGAGPRRAAGGMGHHERRRHDVDHRVILAQGLRQIERPHRVRVTLHHVHQRLVQRAVGDGRRRTHAVANARDRVHRRRRAVTRRVVDLDVGVVHPRVQPHALGVTVAVHVDEMVDIAVQVLVRDGGVLRGTEPARVGVVEPHPQHPGVAHHRRVKNVHEAVAVVVDELHRLVPGKITQVLVLQHEPGPGVDVVAPVGCFVFRKQIVRQPVVVDVPGHEVDLFGVDLIVKFMCRADDEMPGRGLLEQHHPLLSRHLRPVGPKALTENPSRDHTGHISQTITIEIDDASVLECAQPLTSDNRERIPRRERQRLKCDGDLVAVESSNAVVGHPSHQPRRVLLLAALRVDLSVKQIGKSVPTQVCDDRRVRIHQRNARIGERVRQLSVDGRMHHPSVRRLVRAQQIGVAVVVVIDDVEGVGVVLLLGHHDVDVVGTELRHQRGPVGLGPADPGALPGIPLHPDQVHLAVAIHVPGFGDHRNLGVERIGLADVLRQEARRRHRPRETRRRVAHHRAAGAVALLQARQPTERIGPAGRAVGEQITAHHREPGLGERGAPASGIAVAAPVDIDPRQPLLRAELVARHVATQIVVALRVDEHQLRPHAGTCPVGIADLLDPVPLDLIVVEEIDAVTDVVRQGVEVPAQHLAGFDAALARLLLAVDPAAGTRFAVGPQDAVLALDREVIRVPRRAADGGDRCVAFGFGAVGGAHGTVRRTARQDQALTVETEPVGIGPRDGRCRPVLVLRLPAARDRRQPRQRPALSHQPVAGAARVHQPDLWRDARRTGRHHQRHGVGCRPLLVHPERATQRPDRVGYRIGRRGGIGVDGAPAGRRTRQQHRGHHDPPPSARPCADRLHPCLPGPCAQPHQTRASPLQRVLFVRWGGQSYSAAIHAVQTSSRGIIVIRQRQSNPPRGT